MKYDITVREGETPTRHLVARPIKEAQVGLALLGASKEECAEHLGLLLRDGRTTFQNDKNMSLYIEEAI